MGFIKYVVTLSYIMTYSGREVTHTEVITCDTEEAAKFEYDRADEMMINTMRLPEYDTLEAELDITYQYGTYLTEYLGSKVYKQEVIK